MSAKTFRTTDPIETKFLAEVRVRVALPQELARCRQEVCEKQYLKTADLVGEQLWYVAEYQGQWLALLGWCAAAYHLKGRDSWIGWNATQRAAFRCRFNSTTQRYEVPGENCIYRVLKAVPVLKFQLAIWAWQKARLGSADGDVVVLDGKAVRGSQGTQLVGAINARSGRPLGIEAVADKSNEIPAAQTLLQRLDLEGTIALMDALHTQVETARSIVQEGGGDFVMVAKGNQGTLRDQCENLLPEDFSPSALNGQRGARAEFATPSP